MTTQTESTLPASVLTRNQTKTFRKDFPNGNVLIANVRYDDDCGNGHNTFTITGELYDRKYIPGEASIVNSKGKTRWLGSRGCLREEIANSFPELAPLIKWNLVSSDGPMYYIVNTVYNASDRDYRGLLKGEKRQLRNGKTNLPVWERTVRNDKGEKVSLSSSSWIDSEERPTEILIAEWSPAWIIGDGKERDLDAARSCAVWPAATDEQLIVPTEELKAALLERLPGLMAEFKAAVESLGFTY